MSRPPLRSLLRKEVSLVWLAACAGAAVPVVLGVLFRLAVAAGRVGLSRVFYGSIELCFWIPVGPLGVIVDRYFYLSPLQMFFAALVLDSALAAGAFVAARSCFRQLRRLLRSGRIRPVR